MHSTQRAEHFELALQTARACWRPACRRTWQSRWLPRWSACERSTWPLQGPAAALRSRTQPPCCRGAPLGRTVARRRFDVMWPAMPRPQPFGLLLGPVGLPSRPAETPALPAAGSLPSRTGLEPCCAMSTATATRCAADTACCVRGACTLCKGGALTLSPGRGTPWATSATGRACTAAAAATGTRAAGAGTCGTARAPPPSRAASATAAAGSRTRRTGAPRLACRALQPRP